MSPIPFQWNPNTLKDRAQDWVLNLDDFRQVSSLARQADDTKQSWRNHRKLKRLQPAWDEASKRLINRIAKLLFKDTGIAILSCGARTTAHQARLVELLLGCSLGENMTIDPENKGRPIFEVTLKPDSTAGGQYLGNGLKGNAIGLHTDASGTPDRKIEVLAMLYVQPARFGGQSRVANSQLAFERLTPEARAILLRSFPRQSPYKDKNKNIPSELLCIPIFRKAGKKPFQYLEFSYHPARIRNGVKLARATISELENAGYDLNSISTKLTAEESNALGELEAALDQSSCEINLRANEILLLNNQVITHDRRPFWDNPRAPRRMERFWGGRLRTVAGGHHSVGTATCASCGAQ